ncbi:hypothetical protein [Haploplasma modicum]|uniref:hypothetical protein n=1 Tax=Haploplasma modicum TaxID=2150 RepID=UPI00138AB5B2|nr:hypothetical protein [Haploplasma modicum]
MRTENVSSNTQMLLSNKKVDERLELLSSPEYWRIGQSPTIYFEYSRGSKFKLVSATISGSNIDGEMILSDNPGIKLGEGFILDKLSVENNTAFIAEISTPEITEYSEITYDLEGIKIEVGGIEQYVSIPEDSSHISIVSDGETQKQEVLDMIKNTTLVDLNGNYVVVHNELFSNDFGGSVSYNIIVNGKISEDQFWLNYVGDGSLTIEIQAIILGSEMEPIIVYDDKLGASWDTTIYFRKPDGFTLFAAVFDEELRQVIFDASTKNDGIPITIYRTIEGKNIEWIEILDEHSDESELYFRLEGFSLIEVQEMISSGKITTSTKMPVNLIVEGSVISIPGNR